MEYREELEKSWSAFLREHGNGMAIDAAELLRWDQPVPNDGDTWGNWQYNAKAMVLTYLPNDYQIDLEECTTSAQTLDRIIQLCKKTWMSITDIGNMIQALNDLLDPQANLCSSGQDKEFDATKHLKNLRKGLQH
jgi:hypothetical protein